MIAPHLARGHGITWRRLEEWSRRAGIEIPCGGIRRHIVRMATTQIALFTDFGFEGPYVGQMKSVISHLAPNIPVIDLMHDVPAQDVVSAAYLLAALFHDLPAGTVFVAVVDSDVGTNDREPVAVKADGRWLVGPGDGLFSGVVGQADIAKAWKITWRPKRISPSFHGRDLFAPVAAEIALGQHQPGQSCELSTAARLDWPLDLAQIIYIDRFGNAMTGIRAKILSDNDVMQIGEATLGRATTFADVSPGTAMWYENSSGLAEIAVNQGRADDHFGLTVGTEVSFHRA
jgi:S-adenosylmethionine hydrolase